MPPTSVVKALAGAAFIVAGACGLGGIGVRLNASPSLPIGLYVVTSDPTARLVEFCPDEPAASVGLERGYRSRGNCLDGGTPLLKPVVATAGDLVQVSRSGLAVNGRMLPNTEPQIRDTRGRAMKSVPDGTYAVASGTVWVASSYHPRSFDSRYFGPIPVAAIRHRLRPLLIQ
jgi:conjugative transfer signal peptidase TraF